MKQFMLMNTTLVGFEPIASWVCIPIFLRRNLILLLRHTQLIFAVFTMLHHFCLSSVNSINLFTVCFPFDRSNFMSMVAKSCLTVCIQVVFDLPCGRFTFLRHSSRAFLAGVSGSNHMRGPSHVSLRTLIILLHRSHFVLEQSPLFVIFICQWIPRDLSWVSTLKCVNCVFKLSRQSRQFAIVQYS